jgi:pilus assembly protein Flp/PilA
MKKVNRLVRDQRGASLVEYVILVGVVAVLAFGSFKYFGDKVSNKVHTQADSVDQAVPASMNNSTAPAP